MTEATDEFYTFSSTELAAIKADYRQLLADQRAHNRQFQKRNRHFISRLIIVFAVILIELYGFWFARAVFLVFRYMPDLETAYSFVANHWYIYFLYLLLFMVTLVLMLEFVLIKRNKDQAKCLFNKFPTVEVRYFKKDRYPSLIVQQMIKLPAYLIVWPKNKEINIIPSPDRVNCWLIRRADQADLYDKLSSSYRKNLLKNKRTRRWAGSFLVDGTKEA
ncbi:hypothetical protein DLJ48_02075 [Oenococcus sicerae]|uniref:YcxB family protein n=1 Tax=Oenococcus sicerae TaxID=2203724 RepID=A0ABX5QKU0_9LACO|nr:hypothetical protein [Oenococcus sicerae]QAS69394.1 hypothetical protein DLJ48_02075 [Oenococcus sicerae]